MPTLLPLTPEDTDDVRDIISIYLSDLEIRENQELIENACSGELNETFGFGSREGNELVGLMIGTIKTEKESLDDHFNRPTPVSTDSKGAILQHLYVKPDNWGQGRGTSLVRAALEYVKSEGVCTVYAEAWIDPETPNATSIFRNEGFEEIYHSEDYWAHEAFVASLIPCPTHGEPYSECPCEGALYEYNCGDAST